MMTSPGRRSGPHPPASPVTSKAAGAGESERTSRRSRRVARGPTIRTVRSRRVAGGSRRSSPRASMPRPATTRTRSSSVGAWARPLRHGGGGASRPSGLLRLLPGEPRGVGLPGRGVLSGEVDRAHLRVRNAVGSAALGVEHLEVRLGSVGIAVEHVAVELRAVPLHDRGVAPVVEGELDDLGERHLGVRLGRPPLEGLLGLHHARPVTVATTVSRNPRQLEKVSWTAVASNPQWTMQSRHFSLPLRFP